MLAPDLAMPDGLMRPKTLKQFFRSPAPQQTPAVETSPTRRSNVVTGRKRSARSLEDDMPEELATKRARTASEFVRDLKCTPEKVAWLAALKQGTQAWKDARAEIASASRAGPLAGNGFDGITPEEQVREDVDPRPEPTDPDDHSQEPLRWGNSREPDANLFYMVLKMLEEEEKRGFNPDGETTHYKFRIVFPGLVRQGYELHCGWSPDGVAQNYRGQIHLAEYKCPYRRNPYGEIPAYYYDQIQYVMGLGGFPYCDFYVWSTPVPSRRAHGKLTRIDFNPEYWMNTLRPAIDYTYFMKLLPCLLCKEHGLPFPAWLPPHKKQSNFTPYRPIHRFDEASLMLPPEQWQDYKTPPCAQQSKDTNVGHTSAANDAEYLDF